MSTLRFAALTAATAVTFAATAADAGNRTAPDAVDPPTGEAMAAATSVPVHELMSAGWPATERMRGETERDRPRRSSAAAVLEWSAIAENAVATDRGPGPAQVLMATVELAIHDAVIALEDGARGYGGGHRRPRGHASLDAAVATAAHAVLVARVPEQATTVGRLYREDLESIRASARAKLDGISVGLEVASQVIEQRAGDGLSTVVPFEQPAPGPGVFESVGDAPPVGVNLPQVTPFVLESPDQFRPDGPHPLDSDEYATDFAEVRDLGRLDSEQRTPQQTETALFWSDHGFLQWSRALRAIATDARLDAVGAARLLALTHVAAADATIGCFDAKYHYLFWRPVHAIQRADSDGNDATEPDPTWQARVTVNHPEYPAGAACVDAAITTAAASYLGTDEVTFEVTSAVTDTTRHFQRLSDALDEILDARVWSGLHFRTSMDEGAQLGVDVAELVAATLLHPN